MVAFNTSVMPSDCTIEAGFYDLSYTGYLAQHAYAEAPASNVYFQCYGGLEGPNNVFPAELYSPSVISPTKRGTSSPGCLEFACGMAQFLLPNWPDFQNKTNYNSKSGGFLNLGDCSGILYAVSGVCQQMCNRVLFACSGYNRFFQEPINFPPSLYASYVAYGLTGTDAPTLYLFATTLLNHISGNPVSPEAASALHAKFESSVLAHCRELEAAEPIAAQRWSLMRRRFENLDGSVGDTVDWQRLMGMDLAFGEEKRQADLRLLTGLVATNEYADTVNDAFRRYCSDAQRSLPKSLYRHIFGKIDDPNNVDLVSLALMPDGEQYREIGRRSGL